jgi:hypothetical protein
MQYGVANFLSGICAKLRCLSYHYVIEHIV